MEKRQAFQKTVEFHNSMSKHQANAVFASKSERPINMKNKDENARTIDVDRMPFSQISDEITRHASQRSAPRTNTNAYVTSSSFGLVYDGAPSPNEDARRTIGADPGYSMLMIDRQRPAFNATSPRFAHEEKVTLQKKLQPGPGHYDKPESQQVSPNTAVFKSRHARFESPKTLDNNPSPGDYFQKQTPFLKKTFNASLPRPRFI